MKLRKFARVVMFILVILGAIGGVGTLLPHRVKADPHGVSTPNYAAEKAFAAAFAQVYLTFHPSDSSESRAKAISVFAGDASWLGADPAITAPSSIHQSVLQVLPGQASILDAHHITVPVLVHLESGTVDRWLRLIVPVGMQGKALNVYAPPTLTRAFAAAGSVQDKTWSGDAAPANVVGQVQSVLQGFLPLYYGSSSQRAITQYLASTASVVPRDGIVSFVSLDNLTVDGGPKGPWIAVAEVQTADPVTKMHYEEELAIGLEQQASHLLVTGVVVN